MGIHVMAGVDPGYLNAGLMKPRRGFTLVAGNENWGWASFLLSLTRAKLIFILAVKPGEEGR